jgi:hypothetical protein
MTKNLDTDEILHIHYFPDAVVILKEEEEPNTPQVVESIPFTPSPQKPSLLPAYLFLFGYFSLILSTIAFQLFCVFNPPFATIVIRTNRIPITTQATLRVPVLHLAPFIFSKTQTINTTGHGHQVATQARGYVTFYNALTQMQTIESGTLLIGRDGEQVVTDNTAFIPAGNLATNGQATVSAHALNFGPEGNIQAGDIYGACCKALIQVVNGAFSGGQNERDYQAVAPSDVSGVVQALSSQFQNQLQTTVISQVSHDKTLVVPIPCTTSMHSNYSIGAEATKVSITLHKTCLPLVYKTNDLTSLAASALSLTAKTHLGSGYRLIGRVATSITHTTIQNNTLLLSTLCRGSWALAFNIRLLSSQVAGKSTHEAEALLHQSRSIQAIGIHLDGFTDRIPKNPHLIHFVFQYVIG